MTDKQVAVDAREVARRLALMDKRVGRRSLVGGALAAAVSRRDKH